MAFYIQLTAHPERSAGMGLSMNIGGSSPEPPEYKPFVKVTLTGGTSYNDYFTYNKIPAGYYSGRSDIYTVRLTSGMTFGGSDTFRDCTNMEGAYLIGAGTIIARTFQGCTEMTHCTLSQRYTRLEGWVFSGCTSLTSITIPDSVTLIGGYSFMGCSSLDSVVLGSGLTQINQQCFANCISLLEITCTAPTAPTLSANVFQNVASDGTLYVPKGSDYSTWVAQLPQNWTIYPEF